MVLDGFLEHAQKAHSGKGIGQMRLEVDGGVMEDLCMEQPGEEGREVERKKRTRREKQRKKRQTQKGKQGGRAKREARGEQGGGKICDLQIRRRRSKKSVLITTNTVSKGELTKFDFFLGRLRRPRKF